MALTFLKKQTFNVRSSKIKNNTAMSNINYRYKGIMDWDTPILKAKNQTINKKNWVENPKDKLFNQFFRFFVPRCCNDIDPFEFYFMSCDEFSNVAAVGHKHYVGIFGFDPKLVNEKKIATAKFSTDEKVGVYYFAQATKLNVEHEDNNRYCVKKAVIFWETFDKNYYAHRRDTGNYSNDNLGDYFDWIYKTEKAFERENKEYEMGKVIGNKKGLHLNTFRKAKNWVFKQHINEPFRTDLLPYNYLLFTDIYYNNNKNNNDKNIVSQYQNKDSFYNFNETRENLDSNMSYKENDILNIFHFNNLHFLEDNNLDEKENIKENLSPLFVKSVTTKCAQQDFKPTVKPIREGEKQRYKVREGLNNSILFNENKEYLHASSFNNKWTCMKIENKNGPYTNFKSNFSPCTNNSGHVLTLNDYDDETVNKKIKMMIKKIRAYNKERKSASTTLFLPIKVCRETVEAASTTADNYSYDAIKENGNDGKKNNEYEKYKTDCHESWNYQQNTGGSALKINEKSSDDDLYQLVVFHKYNANVSEKNGKNTANFELGNDKNINKSDNEVNTKSMNHILNLGNFCTCDHGYREKCNHCKVTKNTYSQVNDYAADKNKCDLLGEKNCIQNIPTVATIEVEKKVDIENKEKIEIGANSSHDSSSCYSTKAPIANGNNNNNTIRENPISSVKLTTLSSFSCSPPPPPPPPPPPSYSSYSSSSCSSSSSKLKIVESTTSTTNNTTDNNIIHQVFVNNGNKIAGKLCKSSLKIPLSFDNCIRDNKSKNKGKAPDKGSLKSLLTKCDLLDYKIEPFTIKNKANEKDSNNVRFFVERYDNMVKKKNYKNPKGAIFKVNKSVLVTAYSKGNKCKTTSRDKNNVGIQDTICTKREDARCDDDKNKNDMVTGLFSTAETNHNHTDVFIENFENKSIDNTKDLNNALVVRSKAEENNTKHKKIGFLSSSVTDVKNLESKLEEVVTITDSTYESTCGEKETYGLNSEWSTQKIWKWEYPLNRWVQRITI
ncbi:uncharacterized protein SCODWIG_03705 [Saccharomycodes ludwigii]|uniref:Uncharacterized protein n=1 Tax=Saccharomycodes ludwigii TaxID=36035 RepID=A0A376BBM1_9ASCO|nr:uncharacterized protein SCODWIG_03705 [Saccharomycodes ludwigii]